MAQCLAGQFIKNLMGRLIESSNFATPQNDNR